MTAFSRLQFILNISETMLLVFESVRVSLVFAVPRKVVHPRTIVMGRVPPAYGSLFITVQVLQGYSRGPSYQ